MRSGLTFALLSAISLAIAPLPASAEQHCRMEKQCRWVNFKKICTYVKVCRER
jgi:hypothetical protein